MVVLVSICTKFELSMCLVCPTIEINVCSDYLQNVLVHFHRRCFVKATPVNSSILWMYVCMYVCV